MRAHSMTLALIAHRLPPATIFPHYQALPDDLKGSLGINAFLKPRQVGLLMTASKGHYCLFKPEMDALKIQQFVFSGQQKEADLLLTRHSNLQLLLKKGTITDLSGRTFDNITAYEYAYWAKDTHMCRMLQTHMNETTRSYFLARCNEIDDIGLTYQQGENVFLQSKSFDFTPLKLALSRFVSGYDNWIATENYDAFNQAWADIGIAQHNAPAHVINEYCRIDRAFFPRPMFNESTLPRELMFKQNSSHTLSDIYLFFLSLFFVDNQQRYCFEKSFTNLTLFRGNGEARASYDGVPVLFADEAVSRQDLVIDLDAIEYLDEVRTADRVQLRENLQIIKPICGA